MGEIAESMINRQINFMPKKITVSDLRNNYIWTDRFGNETKVINLGLSHMRAIIKMLENGDIFKYEDVRTRWIAILDSELKHRGYPRIH